VPDANAVIGAGRSAIHFAADMGQTEIVTYLVSKGATVDVSAAAFRAPALCAHSRMDLRGLPKDSEMQAWASTGAVTSVTRCCTDSGQATFSNNGGVACLLCGAPSRPA